MLLSRIPTTKNKIHQLYAEMRHDTDYLFRENQPCTVEVGSVRNQ